MWLNCAWICGLCSYWVLSRGMNRYKCQPYISMQKQLQKANGQFAKKLLWPPPEMLCPGKREIGRYPAIKIATDSSILSLRKHAFLVEDILWQIMLPTYMFIVLEGNKHKSQVNWDKKCVWILHFFLKTFLLAHLVKQWTLKSHPLILNASIKNCHTSKPCLSLFFIYEISTIMFYFTRVLWGITSKNDCSISFLK